LSTPLSERHRARHARIAGLGQWFPDAVRSNADWPEAFASEVRKRGADRMLVDVPREDSSDPCRAITTRYFEREAQDPFLGGKERRVAALGLSSSEAEAFAGKAALADAGLDARELDACFSWALVPDRYMPSNACRVAHLLGAERANAATIDAACASPVLQLALAAALVESGRAKAILLTQSHLVSRVFPLMHPASPCVGDGASAMLVTASDRPGIGLSHSVTEGAYYEAVMWCRGKTAETDPPWFAAGGPYLMGSHDPVATKALMRDTVSIGARTVRELATVDGFDPERIDVLCSVQPRGFIPRAIAEGLALRPDAAPDTYERYAHLGGVGPVVNLISARERGLLREGARVVMYAQGAGFTRSAVSIVW
jgi:3-oxoacyl-[acyl-carrier-protein] synthase-3